MLLFCAFLLLSLVHSSFSSETLGSVISYYPKTKHSDGSMEVVIRMKVNSKDCSPGFWQCFSGECGNETSAVAQIVYEDDEYCQVEQIYTLRVPTNAPFAIRSNLYENETRNISHLSEKWRNLTVVDLRTRSDTGKSNSSPQTSVLPNVRVPVNCQRKYRLLKFDPDGDSMQCRLMSITQLKCDNCEAAALLPSFLNSEPCTMVYTPNLIRPRDVLKVDNIMEDFPRTNVNLTYTNGTQETRTPQNSIGKVPVQFIFTDLVHNGPFNMTVTRTGLKEYALVWTPTEDHVTHHPVCYAVQVDTLVGTHQSELRCLVVTVVNVPQYLSMTPANGTRLLVSVNQPIVIFVHVETPTNVFELLFLGPKNMTTSTLDNGLFLLRWTPSDADAGKNFTVSFFVVFANFISSPNPLNNYYQSEFRTVMITVRNVTGATSERHTGSAFLRTRIISAIPLSDEYIQNNVLKQLREELVNQGLTPQITLRLVGSRKKPEETPPK